jgi:hypothetical protein
MGFARDASTYFAHANVLSSIVPLESRQIARELVYVWHSEALDTLDDHWGNTCHFRDSRKPAWITTITLLHWRLKIQPIDQGGALKTGIKFRFSAPFRRKRPQKPIIIESCQPGGTPDDPRPPFPFPPKEIHDFWGQEGQDHWAEQFGIEKKHRTTFRTHLELNSSSVVISTSPFGDFGKCTALSRVVSEATHLALEKTATQISNAFIHQPHTARCLIFIIYLGAICDAISSQYEEILNCLDKPLGLGVRSSPLLRSRTDGVTTGQHS